MLKLTDGRSTKSYRRPPEAEASAWHSGNTRAPVGGAEDPGMLGRSYTFTAFNTKPGSCMVRESTRPSRTSKSTVTDVVPL